MNQSSKQRSRNRREARLAADVIEKVASETIRKKRSQGVRKGTGMKIKSETNKYLQTLIDPEKYRGVRYPDSFPRSTAMVNGLINKDLFVFQDMASAANPNSEPPGTFLSVLSPTMIDPLLSYEDTQPAAGADLQTFLTTPSDRWGLVSLNEDNSSYASDADQMCIQQDQILNVKAPACWSDQDFAIPPMRGFDTNGDVFYGQPFRCTIANASALVVAFGIGATTPAAPSTVFAVDAVTEKGVFRKFCTITAAVGAYYGQATSTFSAAELAALMTVGSSSQVTGRPGLGFRIVQTGGVNTKTLTGISCQYGVTLAAGQPQPRLIAVKYPDEAIYNESVDQYRVVSASSWLEYEGADLTNGGQVAAIMYRGGRSAFENGLWDYSLVAETPGGYQGAVKLGTYSFWMPSNERDMLFRNLGSSERWLLPYIVNVGLVASPDIPHTLRQRITANHELVSTSQFYAFDRAEVHPDWIAHAASVVATLNTSMENPLHWATIKEYLSKAVNMAGDVAGWVGKHWGTIAPAAALAASLL